MNSTRNQAGACYSCTHAIRGAGSPTPHPTGLKSSNSPDYKFPDSLDLTSSAVIEMQGAGEKVTADSINIIGGDGAARGRRAQTKRPLSCRQRRDGPAAAGSQDGGQGQRWPLLVLFPPPRQPSPFPHAHKINKVKWVSQAQRAHGGCREKRVLTAAATLVMQEGKLRHRARAQHRTRSEGAVLVFLSLGDSFANLFNNIYA